MPKYSIKAIRLGIPKRPDFRWGLVVSALQALSALALMATSAWLISRAAQQPPVMYLMVAVVGVRAFALGRATFRYIERLMLHNAALGQLSELRPKAFERLIPLVPAGLDSNRAETVTRLVEDVDESQNMAIRLIAPILQALVVSTAAVLFFWSLVPTAGAWLLACLIIAMLCGVPASAHLAKRANESSARDRADFNQAAATLIEHLDILQSFGWLESRRDELRASQRRLSSSARRRALSEGVGQSFFLLLASLAVVGTSYFAATQVASADLEPVLLAVFALVPIAVFDALNGLNQVPGVWQRYLAGTSRVVELLDRKPDPVIADPGGEAAPYSFSDLRLENIQARYPDSSNPVVSSINLNLLAGENALITGASGSGKTTIAQLLLGFLNPTGGEYLINGVSRNSIDSHALRRLIGYQEQTPMIFRGSLRSNLQLAKPEVSDSELWDVLSRVRLADVFARRDGLDTQLGDFGVAISGGEAQRIALARSILADFKVIIFDEPTANVDPETSRELMVDLIGIAKDLPGRASIFISHDPLVEELVDGVRLSLTSPGAST